MAKKHLIIPDTQCKPGHSFEYLSWIGQYIVDQKPDVVIQIGDFADMESLSSYDQGKKSFEGRRYVKDVQAAKDAMDVLLSPLRKAQEKAKRNKEKIYKPRLVLTLGNHEARIKRAINDDPKLEGLIKYEDLPYTDWEVHDFLQPVFIDGVAYCHYFTSGVMGRPVSSPTLLLSKKHMSCVMGHVQDRGIAYARRADGKRMTGLFAGICYQHDEDYLTPQTNGSWAGVWMFNEVNDGSFDELPVSLSYLKEKYA